MKKRLCALLLASIGGYNAFAAWHELLQDSSFEQQTTYWSAYALSGGDSLSAGIVNLGNARTGSWYAYVGDYNTSHFNAIGVVRQIVTIPANTSTAKLDFYLDVTSQETTTVSNYDRMGAYLRTYPGDTQVVTFHEWSNLDKDSNGNKTNYIEQIYSSSVSSYAGQQVILQFYAQTDSSKSTTFRIDDVSLKAYVPDYTNSVSAGANGSVTPSGNSIVEAGQSLSMTATPASNYVVDQWYTNGVSAQTGGNSFSLQNIKTNGSVLVTFKARLYNLTVQVHGSGNYSISPLGGSYATGTPITITPSPDPGNQFSEWQGAQYSRNTVLSFAKGGADESIDLYFVPLVSFGAINTITANSTPATIGINLPTPQSWITMCEFTADLISPCWSIVGITSGQATSASFLSAKGGGGFYRTATYPLVTTPPFLSFPIHNGDTPFNAPVTAIMDHHRTNDNVARGPYDHDWAIRTSAGATYPKVSGTNYAVLPVGISASTVFHYVGVSTPGQAGPGYLQYDGHPAYDYGYGMGTDVYAAAAGTVLIDDDLAGSSLAGTGIVGDYMTKYHALIIRHDQGYCTIYMHLSAIDSAYVDTSDTNNWKPVKAFVGDGAHIGKTGNYDALDSHLSPHFHFEVWRLDNGNAWKYADPYGYFGPGNSGGVQTLTPSLWK